MRAALLVCLLLASVVQLSAQEPSTGTPAVSRISQQMKSPKWAERSKAFDEASEALASGKLGPNDTDRLKLRIIQLLVHENNGGLKEQDDEAKQASANANGASEADEGEGEEESDYYSGLIAFVAALNDERAIPALLGAANTGGIATRGVARFGKRAIEPTLVQVKSQNADLAEGALWVIRDMLEFRLVSDPESHVRIKDVLRSALRSPEFGVRVSAMGAIEYLDDREEFVSLLKEVSEHDPVKLAGQRPDDGGDNGEFYPARFDARRLLRKIANHEQARIDRGLPPSEYQPVKP
jgi:hypothetical protein